MVSLIVPCYNAEAFLERCIDSILAQTYKDIELILVNDGSTDGSNKIIESRRSEIEETLSAFVYLQQENRGVGAACSAGFSVATGDYVCLLDTDDLLLPESVRLRAEFLDSHPEYALVRTNGYYVDEDHVDVCNRLLEVNDHMKVKEDVFEDIFNSTTYLWPGTYMIRMSVLDRLYPDHQIYPSRSGQNMQFVMMAAYKNRAGFVDVPLMKYVVRKESLSHFSGPDALKRQLKAMEGYEDIRRYLIDHHMEPSERAEWHKKTDILYARVRMNMALSHKDKQLMVENYQRLTQCTDGHPDWNDRVTYYQLMNPAVAVALRAMGKLKRVLLHIYWKTENIHLAVRDYILRKKLGTPRVLSMDETLDLIIRERCSVSRYGDGEMKIVAAQNIRFQAFDPVLSRRLAEILKTDDKKHLVCISDIFEGAHWMLPKAREYTWKIVARNRKAWTAALNLNYTYGNAFLSRCYMDWKDKSRCAVWFDKVKKIWENRDVVILEGEQSRLGYQNDLFEGATSVRRILCPPRNAFEKYDEILQAAKTLPQESLILLALGPTATVLAWDLAQAGYQALDIGHVDIEYEWFRMGATQKVPVAKKYTNEAIGGDVVSEDVNDAFRSQIITVIK